MTNDYRWPLGGGDLARLDHWLGRAMRFRTIAEVLADRWPRAGIGNLSRVRTS